MVKYTITLVLLTTHLLAYGQQISDSVSFTGITGASQDSRGMLYIGTSSGDIIRLSDDMKTDLLFSPDRPAEVSTVDASNSLRTFVFYNDLQEFIYLDRFLTESARYSIAGFTTFAGLVAPSLDNNIWVFDQQQYTISKLNPLMRAVDLTIPLERSLPSGNYLIEGMSEYQNLLFLTDTENGILIFDNLGNYLDRIEFKGLNHISFYENSIIASTPAGFLIIDIYSRDKVEVALPFPPDMSFQNKNGFRIVKNDTIYAISIK